MQRYGAAMPPTLTRMSIFSPMPPQLVYACRRRFAWLVACRLLFSSVPMFRCRYYEDFPCYQPLLVSALLFFAGY